MKVFRSEGAHLCSFLDFLYAALTRYTLSSSLECLGGQGEQ